MWSDVTGMLLALLVLGVPLLLAWLLVGRARGREDRPSVHNTRRD